MKSCHHSVYATHPSPRRRMSASESAEQYPTEPMALSHPSFAVEPIAGTACLGTPPSNFIPNNNDGCGSAGGGVGGGGHDDGGGYDNMRSLPKNSHAGYECSNRRLQVWNHHPSHQQPIAVRDHSAGPE